MRNESVQKMDIKLMRQLINEEGEKQAKDFFLSHDFALGLRVATILNRAFLLKAPMLMDDIRLGIVIQGEMQATINLKNYTIRPGYIIYMGKGCIAQINRISEDFSIKGIVMKEDFFKRALHGRELSILGIKVLNFARQVSPQEAEIVELLIESIWKMVHLDSQIPMSTLYNLMATIVSFYESIQQKDEMEWETGKKPHQHSHRLFEQFIQLVNRHCTQQRQLSFYADSLCLTQRYLSSLVKQVSHTTAKEWIDRAVISNIKVQLLQTDLQVSQIADRMNFSTNSFFCKYFKRLTGMTPESYRLSEGKTDLPMDRL